MIVFLVEALCTLVHLLALTVHADVQVPINSNWNSGFQGDACFDITSELHSWNITMTFDLPVLSLETWTADVVEIREGGKVFVLQNKEWNKEEHVGDKLCLGFQGHTNGDMVPKLTASISGLPNGGSNDPTTTYTSIDVTVVRNRLVIDGNHFTYNGKRIFLSGGNLPWISYAHDFGDGQFQSIKNQLEEQLKKLHEAGGNSLRLWIHVQGETSPAFDSNGMVTGLDTKGTFLDDFKELLRLALQYNIFLFPTLWNAGVDQDPHHRLDGLLRDSSKLQSYIDNALTPLVKSVNAHPALGGWDIMHEPEGMLNPDVNNDEPCFNTTFLLNSGVGWAVKKYDYEQILRFLNWQAAAIKAVDTNNIVSVGVWNPKSNTDQFGMFDFYSDSCLVKAGGKPLGVMDFFQYHSNSWHGVFDDVSPFKHSSSDYKVNKPILIGGFWETDGGGMTITQMFDYVYKHGYAGAWSWDLLGEGDSQRAAIAHIKDYTDNGQIPIVLQ
ncbi:mannan endo-1,4-beta-mannosidase-like isoform X2 [Biomphalaria glabrata]|uniref:Mannan endo-1,4-beta-mannosidase-like isoform X2 n=1 Tax=Biomphalaria glabrata TaxID=6526 RepID=A0A9W3B886_BIOGL|nr:mannan endo-1,4-beta-mannosidase-like isoform X2 [Biomphalaria glabrata]